MDFVQTESAQRANAGEQLGVTNVPMPGRTDILWPNLPGFFAGKLIDFWLAEADRLKSHVAAIPSTATRTAWLRAVDVLASQRGPAAKAAPHALLPVPQTVLVWTSLDQVVLPLQGLLDTPTKWELVQESVVEAVQDLRGGTSHALVLLVVAALALLVLRGN